MDEKKFLNGVKNVGNLFVWYAIFAMATYSFLLWCFPSVVTNETTGKPDADPFMWIVIVGLAVELICTAFVRGYERKS